jgi:putative transcriptional regulator
MFYALPSILPDMPRNTPLRNRVKELRERLNVRQSTLAREAGVTRQTIIAIEKGRLNPSILISLKIAKLLREPVDYIFYLQPGFDYEQEARENANRPKRGRKKRVPAATREEALEGPPETLEVEREADAADMDADDETVETGEPEESPATATDASINDPEVPVDPDKADGHSGDEPKSGQAIWDFF